MEPLATMLCVVVAGLVFLCPGDHLGNGRHVSRPVGRLLRWPRHRVIFGQASVCLAGIVGLWTFVLVVIVTQLLLGAWVADDWITGEPDDDGDRRFEWARNKLKALKPVKVRPVESWQPA